jgi:hypothetical protein
MLSKLRPHLTYANVIATLALFVALGGGAYAVTQINGTQIKKHSLPGNRLEDRAVVPRARIADRTAKLLITRQPASSRTGTSRADDSAGTTPSLVGLSVGEQTVLFEQPPFVFSAACDDDGGHPRATSLVTSSENGWTTSRTAGAAHAAGDTVVLATSSDQFPGEFNPSLPATVTAADRTSVEVHPTVSSQYLGSDCVFFQYLIGG